MTITFHTHSGQFCRHASDSLESMVQAYINKGFKTIGLSEHCPRFKKQDLYPEESDITPQDLETQFSAYISEAKRLRLKYSPQIEILIGAETEYLGPEYIRVLKPILEKNDLDFLVGSLHHVNGIPIDFDTEMFQKALESCQNSYSTLFETYFDAQYELLKELKPSVVGHFDLIRLFAPSFHETLPSELTWTKVKRNIQFIIEYGGLFEINSRGWKKGLPSAYPLHDIASYIVSQGGRFTLGDDAHATKDIGLNYILVPDYLVKLQVNNLWRFTKNMENNNIQSHNESTHLEKCHLEQLTISEIFDTFTESK